MSESPLKLFGWTMPSLFLLPLTSESSSSSSSSRPPLMVNDGIVSDKLDNKSIIEISSDFNKETKEVSDNNSSDQQSEITTTTSTTSEDNKTMNLKKPDKILPCPRCKSADTKFCYYNNYNVNQPRYFCRNCQRYWTAGGSMRSVPIGSGRRKNKGWASSDHHNYLHINDTKNSSKILTFGSSNSSITEDSKITSESTSPQGFLPQQVTYPVSSPWPNNQQWSSTTAGFYPMPLYWACTVPFWPTQETVTNSTSLGKRTRDQNSDESIREGKDNIDDELSLGRKNHVWSPVAMRREKKERLSFFNGFDETKSSNRRLMVPENVHNLQVNPAAMARSMSFRESM